MRNLMPIFLLLITITSCKRHNSQQLKRLNIQAFEKHQSDGAWQYKDTKGNEVFVQKESGEYWESITSKADVFTLRNNYFLNGRLNFSGRYFHDNGFNTGTWTYYDRNGKVIRTEDKDAPFKKYPWEQVLAYLKKNRVNVRDKQTDVNNVSDPKESFWLLSWKTGRINAQGFDIIKHVRIDVNSGRETLLSETTCCAD